MLTKMIAVPQHTYLLTATRNRILVGRNALRTFENRCTSFPGLCQVASRLPLRSNTEALLALSRHSKHLNHSLLQAIQRVIGPSNKLKAALAVSSSEFHDIPRFLGTTLTAGIGVPGPGSSDWAVDHAVDIILAWSQVQVPQNYDIHSARGTDMQEPCIV